MRVRKRRRKFSKMAIIYLGIVISLNLVGLGYGHWSNTINVQNIMATGDVKAAFSRNLSSVGSQNTIYGVSDEHSMNIVMNVDMVNTCEAYFEIVNDGTLPIAINNQTFKPIRDVIIAGLPINIKIEFDVPGDEYFNRGLANGYIEPGNKGYGKVIVKVLEQFNDSSLVLMNDSIVNNNLVGIGIEGLAVDNMITPGNVINNIITESQSIPIDIPIGCGTWEEVLTLNTTLNVNRILNIQLPEINNRDQTFTYFEDQNQNNTFMFSEDPGYTYLADGNAGYGIEQNGSLSISSDGNIMYSYIADENESKSIFGNGEINYNNPSISENGTNTNSVYQFNNGGN
ncbi:MAG: hypothetical protein K0R09_3875 [Clostridiales bacterium]|nr:hypothetical protein [Clostridiales bacterium]